MNQNGRVNEGFCESAVDSQNKREQGDDNAAKDVFQTFQMKVLG